MTVRPFQVSVSSVVLDDLRTRLGATRWPDSVAGAGWDHGADLGYMRELVAYWQGRFDWRTQEAKLNELPHFRAEIDGLGIHFVHVRGEGSKPLPIVLTHGWQGSFFEFAKLIPLLTQPAAHGADPADAFDVVVPSLPGFAFSERPTTRGMNLMRTADLWAKLMSEQLG
jgi:hypothetical protein